MVAPSADGVVVRLDRAVEEEDRAAVTLAPAGDEGRYRIAEVVPAASGRPPAQAERVGGQLPPRTRHRRAAQSFDLLSAPQPGRVVEYLDGAVLVEG